MNPICDQFILGVYQSPIQKCLCLFSFQHDLRLAVVGSILMFVLMCFKTIFSSKLETLFLNILTLRLYLANFLRDFLKVM